MYEAEAVRKEAANIGQQTQDGYKNDEEAFERKPSRRSWNISWSGMRN